MHRPWSVSVPWKRPRDQPVDSLTVAGPPGGGGHRRPQGIRPVVPAVCHSFRRGGAPVTRHPCIPHGTAEGCAGGGGRHSGPPCRSRAWGVRAVQPDVAPCPMVTASVSNGDIVGRVDAGSTTDVLRCLRALCPPMGVPYGVITAFASSCDGTPMPGPGSARATPGTGVRADRRGARCPPVPGG